MNSVYGKIAGIDVHKKWLYVVAGDKRQRFGSTVLELEELSHWLEQEQVNTVVMESTALYWKPVWIALRGLFQQYLAQAQSNRARAGRKQDFRDAERLIRRLAAQELDLSFVPEPEQQEWRMLTRQRVEYSQQLTRVRNHIEALLEEARIKISGYLSDLLSLSGRRMLKALSLGENDPATLAQLADPRVRATQEELAAALTGHMTALQRLLLRQDLSTIELLEQHMEEVSAELTRSLEQHTAAIERLCEIPGVGVSAAEQILAEVGPTAATFPTQAHLSSWAGLCPGREESAGVSQSNTCPKGNRSLRRILSQVAWSAVRMKNSFFQCLFRRLTPRLGVQKAIWAVAHRILRVIWIVLHRGESYRELGPLAGNPQHIQRKLRRMVRELTHFGYQILAPVPTSQE